MAAAASRWLGGRGALLGRLTQKLLLSAEGRHLAIDLAERHGEKALDVLDERLSSTSTEREGAVLQIARRELLKLLPLLRSE